MQAVLSFSHVVLMESFEEDEEFATAYLKLIIADDLEAEYGRAVEVDLRIPLTFPSGASLQQLKESAIAQAKQLLSNEVLDSLPE